MTPALIAPFEQLVGKPAAEINIALSANAADDYTDHGHLPPWLAADYQAMEDAGLSFTHIDLRNYRDPGEFAALLSPHDVLWFSGGNTFYLRWLLAEIGAEAVIRDFLAAGKVYAGASAGAIVAGPTLAHVELADDPALAPQRIDAGMSLTQTVVVPHYDVEGFQDITHDINRHLRADGFTTCPLNNDQALIINGHNHTVLP